MTGNDSLTLPPSLPRPHRQSVPRHWRGASEKGARLVSRGKIVTTPTRLLRRRNHRERAATRTVRPSDAETQKRLTRMECEARALVWRRSRRRPRVSAGAQSRVLLYVNETDGAREPGEGRNEKHFSARAKMSSSPIVEMTGAISRRTQKKVQ